MSKQTVVVIGAGAAGMACARTLAQHDICVTLIDEQPQAGGQIYRNLTANQNMPAEFKDLLGSDYFKGADLIKDLDHPQITHHARCVIWQIDEDGTVYFSVDGKAHSIKADYVVVATGALERPTPVKGWTLAGVMGAGAAQVAMKRDGIVPSGDVVLAGCGPLLLLVAQQLAKAGCQIKALLDSTTTKDHVNALPSLLPALSNMSLLKKGMEIKASLKKLGVPHITGVEKIKMSGDDALEQITYYKDGKSHTLACDTALMHQGVVPNIQISRQLNLDHQWDEPLRCWHPTTDDWGQSSNQNIFVAGDSAGIIGALGSQYSATLSALKISVLMGKLPESDLLKQAAPIRKKLKAEQAVRPFINTLFKPKWLCPDDEDVVVCRCEETTVKDIKRSADIGCSGPNQLKSFTRAGMGPCQGRYCGLSVVEILAHAQNTTPDKLGYYRIRPPLKPLRLSEVASLNTLDQKDT